MVSARPMTRGGRESDAPAWAELVESGFVIAKQLGLSMASSELTVHPEVLAGRLGHLRLLLDVWEPEQRKRAFHEEHAQVYAPPDAQPSEAGPPEVDAAPVAKEPTQSRWRRGGRDRRVNARVQPQTDDYLAQAALQRGVSKSELLDEILSEWVALQESLRCHREPRKRETDDD
jgi:hypothetical protein